MKFVKTEFDAFVTKKVENYLKENNLTKYGGYKIYLKSLILLLTFVFLFAKVTFYADTCGWIEKVLLGVNIAFIGFCVMHDGSHGSFAKNKKLNAFAAKSIDVIGGVSSFLWKVKHVIIHHTFPNTTYDDDIGSGILIRMSKNQPVKTWHRFQHIYALPAYGLLQFFWVFFTDWKEYTVKKIKDFKIKKIKPKDHIYFWIGKSLHLFLFFGLPCMLGNSFKDVFWQYVIISVSCGVITAIVFQLAHVVESSTFQENTENPQRGFMEHQLYETANFYPKNRIVRSVVSTLVGGLDHQIEHHLFPNISHIHYAKISPIVKAAALQFGYPYNEYTLSGAVTSHFKHLYGLRK